MINIKIQNTEVSEGTGGLNFKDVSDETSKKVLELLLEDFKLDD